MIPGQVLSSQSDLAEDKVGDPRYLDASKLPYMRLVGCLLYVMTCTRQKEKEEKRRKKNEILAKTQTTHKNNTLVKHWFHY